MAASDRVDDARQSDTDMASFADKRIGLLDQLHYGIQELPQIVGRGGDSPLAYEAQFVVVAGQLDLGAADIDAVVVMCLAHDWWSPFCPSSLVDRRKEICMGVGGKVITHDLAAPIRVGAGWRRGGT